VLSTRVKTHRYETCVQWAADGQGTKSYRSYSRNFTIAAHGRPDVRVRAIRHFMEMRRRLYPEELLVASLSRATCFGTCISASVNGITVLDYLDKATGTMEGAMAPAIRQGGASTKITIARAEIRRARLALHEEAHRLCFIARIG